jgi:predicted RNase H-like HicB family nuclease
MELEGRIWREGNGWLVEVAFLDVMTQGRSRKEALAMLQDAILELVRDAFEDRIERKFAVDVTLYEDGILGVGATDDTVLMALGLRRQRALSGSSIREVAERLQASSPNGYARYERAEVRPSFEKYSELVRAVNPARRPLLIS